MKVLLVLAFLLWFGADARHTDQHLVRHHTPHHGLSDKPWITGETHRYLFTVNMTVGIPGMTSQVAKSVIKMDVNIKLKTDTECLLKLDNVQFSRPSSSADSPDEPVVYTRYPELERELVKPIKFTFEDGEVKSYTLGESESLQSKSIKRGILRHLEMKIHPDAKTPRSGEDHPELYPLVYNTTESNEMGTFNEYYGITVSPYPWFPYEDNVYNISKTIDYEPYGYPSFHEHDNFAKKGCPGVCQIEDNSYDNKYSAGCPGGYEPHQNLLKASMVVHHNYFLARDQMVIETINAHESITASMYDQDILINIESQYTIREISKRNIDDPKESQIEYTELPTVPTEEDLMKAHPTRPNDISKEYRWLYGIFDDLRSIEVVSLAEQLLDKVCTTIMRGDIESTRGQEVAQDVSQLQEVMSLLKKSHFEAMWPKITDVRALRRAEEKEKIKRQIFLDVLPLCGTDESIEFIKYLMQEKKLSIWEAKEVLEAIPANIIEVNDKNIRDLWAVLGFPDVHRNHMLHSAAHLTLANTIREGCIVPLFSPDDYDEEDEPSDSSLLRQLFPKKLKIPSMYGPSDEEREANEFEVPALKKSSKIKTHYKLEDEAPLCSSGTVDRFLQEMRSKLKSTNKLQEKLVYMQAIAHIGHKNAVKILKPYAYGFAEDIASFSLADVDYIKMVTLYAMHHIVGFYPNETLEVAAAVYFNRTEAPRVRNAAFSTLIRSEPPLAVLQHVAQDLWDEPSNEVGSYVYSALKNFGNSSSPCMKLTADRIKLVMSQVKNYDIGIHHSRSVMKTFFDDLNKLLIEKRFSVVHSNESFVPHSIYSSLKYGLHSMRDVFFEFAVNIQGVSLEDWLRRIDFELLGLKMPRDISSSVEREIFRGLTLLPRLPKDLRITVYKKIFYTACYNYFDAESFQDFFVPLKEYLRDYLVSERGMRKGHLVKTFIPSSIHSMTYSSLGLPLDFRMKHPLVLSLKVESKRAPRSSGLSFAYYVRPSVYYATYYKKSILNIFDRHAYGVYHEQKHTFTFPVEVAVYLDTDSNLLEIKYKLPELPKRIYRHHSEAGTFETELKLSKIYNADLNRDTIEVIPALFKRERIASGFGLPPLYIVHHTEEITGQNYDLPRCLEDVIEMAIETVGNPGWKRRDFNATIVSRPSSTVNEITFKISYNKTLDVAGQALSPNPRPVSPSRGSLSWMLVHGAPQDEDDDADEYSESTYPDYEAEDQVLSKIWKQGSSRSENEEISSEQAVKIIHAFSGKLSKIAHEFSINVETKPTVNRADFRVEYNCTFDKMLHSVMAWAEVKTSENRKPHKMCLAHIMRYLSSPSEFHYDLDKYTGQAALFHHGVSFGEECETRRPDVIAKGGFFKVPSKDLFAPHEFAETPDREAFYPEAHEECMRDIREGKSQSPACISATVEESHLNKFFVAVAARKDLPPLLQNVTYKLDRAIKHYYSGVVDINRVNVNNPRKEFKMSMNYYEKLTDTPFVKVWMEKPDENVIYKRINSEYLLPLSSVHPLHHSYVIEATNNTYMPSCGLMEKHVRTYDMKVYPLPQDTCTYILSTHCAERKKFAVLAKRISASRDEKEIIVYTAGNKVVLKPSISSGVYELLHNDNSMKLRPEKPIMLLDPETKLYAYLVPVFGHEIKYVLHLHSDVTGLKIHYDGKNTKLQVHPLYKGKLCGLCSEFDGEITREYRGPNMCLYSDSQEFAHSSVVDPESCGVNPEPRKPVICPSGEYSIPAVLPFNPDKDVVTPYYEEDEDSEVAGQSGRNQPIRRTLSIERRGHVCFTTKPVPVCEEGSEPEDEYDFDVDYHCLPKNDVTTSRLLIEKNSRILTELVNKEVDFSDTVSAARSCYPY